ncbi:MAG: U32 family peptidase, partial [Anaeroplasmataceae bacterium]|nr:U32 family peptidase [Anaeroplasmataceae bacterium]
LFYITDIGLGHLLKGLGLIERTIFDPKTMITNHLDAEIYASYGFHALGISNEITLKDYKAILEKTNIKAFYQVFGYRLMFTSRRKLVSLYSEKIQKSIALDNLSIEEATRLREERYPIYEDQYGTKIYRNHLICLLKEIIDLPMEYAFLDDMLISSDIFKEIISLFHSAIERRDISSLLERLDQLKLPISDGFSYKDSVYMKEEF